jgi:hypothetical protein
MRMSVTETTIAAHEGIISSKKIGSASPVATVVISKEHIRR